MTISQFHVALLVYDFLSDYFLCGQALVLSKGG